MLNVRFSKWDRITVILFLLYWVNFFILQVLKKSVRTVYWFSWKPELVENYISDETCVIIISSFFLIYLYFAEAIIMVNRVIGSTIDDAFTSIFNWFGEKIDYCNETAVNCYIRWCNNRSKIANDYIKLLKQVIAIIWEVDMSFFIVLLLAINIVIRSIVHSKIINIKSLISVFLLVTFMSMKVNKLQLVVFIIIAELSSLYIIYLITVNYINRYVKTTSKVMLTLVLILVLPTFSYTNYLIFNTYPNDILTNSYSLVLFNVTYKFNITMIVILMLLLNTIVLLLLMEFNYLFYIPLLKTYYSVVTLLNRIPEYIYETLKNYTKKW